MGLLNTLTFDGVISSDYGVYISGDGAFDAPARRGEMIPIPGRNGALFLDENSFENIEVTYPAFIGENNETDFREQLREFRSELLSRRTYKRLEDTYHPDEFRLGVFRNGLEVEPTHYTRAGGFELVFDCKPQRFLVSGETPVTYSANGSITNPTQFDALPLIRVTGIGTFVIGDYEVTVNNNPGTLTIDCELMETFIPAGTLEDLTDENIVEIVDSFGRVIQVADGWTEPINYNAYVEFADHKYPRIKSGTVNVGLQNTISMLEITPRWWRL